MRIRSIRPEFWRSGAISQLSIEDRLLFIGLWSYVDDNGVGVDKLSNIVADLFADDVEEDPRETFARVSRGLENLSASGRITRYAIDGRHYLHITNWDEHQKIDRPGKARYPLPTREDALIRDTLATVSRDIRDTPSTGEGEKGRRGEGEKKTSALSAVPADALFDAPTPPATEEKGINLIGEWLDSLQCRPPENFIPRMGRQVKDLRKEGYEPETIREALNAWNENGKAPESLPSFVYQVQRGRTNGNERHMLDGYTFEDWLMTDPMDMQGWRARWQERFGDRK